MKHSWIIAALLLAAPATAGEPAKAPPIYEINLGNLPPAAETHDLVIAFGPPTADHRVVADKGYRMCGPISFRNGLREVLNIPAGKCLPEDSSAVKWGGGK